MIKSEVFKPDRSHGAKQGRQPFPEDVAILMGTPVGSLVRDRHGRLGDTGVRAQALAIRLGVSVMAYQDLGPDIHIRNLPAARRRLSGNNFAEYASESAETLGGRLEDEGLRRVLVRAHSGNGPLGTALCLALPKQRSGITVSHLALSDPVGLREVGFLQGLGLWHRYNTGSAKRTPLDHRTEGNHPRNTLRAFLGDAAIRGTTTWLTTSTLVNLKEIARESTTTAVLLHLPGNTLNGTPKEVKDLADKIQVFGQQHRGATDAPFKVRFEPDDYHSSAYDNTERNAEYIRDTVELAPFS